MSNQGRGGGPELETALDKTSGKVGDLRRQLSRAVVDHVSIRHFIVNEKQYYLYLF